MALATKCPHCNTVFRVAHDQLKLRGGIVRCGACNEVFDGNAALVEPPIRPPIRPPADPLPAAEPAEQALELQAEQVESALADPEPEADVAELPLDQEIDLDLDLNVDEELPAVAATASAADVLADGRREPGFDTPQEHLVAVALDELHHFDADETHSTASISAEDPRDEEVAEATDALDAARSVIASSTAPAAAALRASRMAPAIRLPVEDELQEAPLAANLADAAAIPAASSAGDAPAWFNAASAVDADAGEIVAAADAKSGADESAATAASAAETHQDEPDFIKRDRRRQQLGKAARVVMACALPLLLGGLLLQGLTTFRNSLAASVPELKPALVALCASVGCKVDYPTQIDALSVEQGELQAMTDSTFSYATVLRNQSRTAQAWPHLELILNDSADKPLLRRVFAPREYLATPAEVDKGFTPRSEQTVKLYFELRQLKASGYHIAIFYP
ncbi:DUF3426 domain-containing protein [Massilia sp. BJB1822]|uniref:DUF3426 domain-containing protein n=1 Tax=Massilia sp. BJB1822 TaxID=2744470 RepID=UPI00159463FF|nr:DUF3426 domain-containing protein [Massilia sp. BJB1822]NVD98968.1 DUF3426 domain-containing protein [Massilia sp. BJB1822]